MNPFPKNRLAALTVKILRDQLGQCPDEAIVYVDGVAMSQASYGFTDTKLLEPRTRLFFVPRACCERDHDHDGTCDRHPEI